MMFSADLKVAHKQHMHAQGRQQGKGKRNGRADRAIFPAFVY